jgi:MFS family permease
MVQPALPDFVRDFQISYDTSSWILSAFLIAGAVTTPIGGKLSDIYGKKRVLLIIMSIYSAGVLAAGFANGIAWMIVARVAMGAGFSAFPVAFSIIRESLPESKLAIGQTVFGSTFSVGAVIGLVLGAGVIQAYGWHSAFFAVFPVAVILTVFIRVFVREPSFQDPPQKPMAAGEPNPGYPTKASLDFKGIFLLATSVVSFLTGLSFFQTSSSDPAAGLRIAGLFSVAVVSLALLVVAERRTAFPLVDFKLLGNGRILPATVILMVVGLCTFMVYQTISILVQSPPPLGFGGDKVATAGVLLPFMVVFLFGTIGSGFVLNRLGNVRMTAIGTSLSAVGFVGLLAFHASEGAVTFMLAVIAAGLSFAFTGGFNIVLLSSPMESTGVALGMVLLLNLIFNSIGPTVAATFQQTYQEGVPGVAGVFPSQEAYYLIFLTAAALSLLSVVLSLWLTRGGQAVRLYEEGGPRGQ